MKRTVNKQEHVMVHDPSIRAWGWAVLDWDGFVVDRGCIKTENSNKKLRIRKGDDRVRRIDEIYQILLLQIKKYNVKYLIAELPHGSQNAPAAVMIGVTTTIVQSFSSILGIGVEWYSEADAKKAILGRNSATKQEVIYRIDKLYDVEWFDTKYKDEALADALAIHYVAMKQSGFLKAMNKISEHVSFNTRI